MGARTIAKVSQFDLDEVIRFRPDIVFLQIRTNDLAQRGMSPLTVGSAIEDFVRLLRDEYGVHLICVGETIKRHLAGNFNDHVQLLTQYLKTVLEPLPFAFDWTHRGFWRASSSYLSYNGVHLNREGLHKLFKSIRGAVMQCNACGLWLVAIISSPPFPKRHLVSYFHVTPRSLYVVKRGVTLNVATNKSVATVAKFIQQHLYYVSS